MKRRKLLLFFLVGMFVFPAAIRAAEKEGVNVAGPAYRIGPGDILSISAWKNADLTRDMPVLPDGRIAFPLLGELMAAGKTPAELKGEMEQKLKQYISDPVLTILVARVNSLRVYVIGKVNKPGMFELNENVNVLQALAMAGGLNTFAKNDKIQVFREEKGNTVLHPFNYDQVAKGDGLQQNIMLVRGDVIVVP